MDLEQATTGAPQQDRPVRTWLQVLGADRNPDALPGHVCPTDGCSECGEVFGEIAEVGLDAERYGWCDRLDADGKSLAALPMPPYLRRVRAVRLLCLSGHVTEIEIPSWGLPWSVLGFGATVVAVYAMYALTKGKP